MGKKKKLLNSFKIPFFEIQDPGLKKTLQFTLSIKISILVLIFLGYHFLTFNLPNYQANYIYPPGETPNAWTPYKTWDGQIFIYLADHGYQPDRFTNAFYPLFPFLIHITGLIGGGNTLLMGLLISHLFTLGAVAFLYLIGRKRFGERAAFFGCLFLLLFPTGFYLGLVYTESLFLLLATSFFYFMDEKKYNLATLCAFLLPLTRPTGIFIFFPAFFFFMNREWRKGRKDQVRFFSPMAGVVAGFALYLGIMWFQTGDPFAGFAAQKYSIGNFSTMHLFQPFDWLIRNFINIDYSFLGVGTSILNRLFFLFYLWMLWVSRRSLNHPLFVYCLVMGLVPALAGNMASYLRYLLVLFPLFLVMAEKWKGKEWYFLVPSFLLQVYLTVRHSLNYFVA